MLYHQGDLISAEYDENKEKTEITLIFDKNLLPLLTRQRSNVAEIRFEDKRFITPKQRRKLFALVRDIAYEQGIDDIEYYRRLFNNMLKAKLNLDTDYHISWSNCSVQIARELITLILDTCLEYDIPLRRHGLEYADDYDAYFQSCLKYRKCAVTGTPNADIHHVLGDRKSVV